MLLRKCLYLVNSDLFVYGRRSRNLLLSILPETERSTYVYIERANYSKLGYLDAEVENSIVLLRDAFLFFAQ